MARTRKSDHAANASGPTPAEIPVLDPAPPASKIAQVTRMLQRTGGATLVELVETTGWLPHTTRAALTGLRKKGFVLDKQSRDGVTAYIIAKAA